MMYTNTPSQEASEAFLTYYLGPNEEYWQQSVDQRPAGAEVHRRPAGVPPRTRTRSKIVEEWHAGLQDLRRTEGRAVRRDRLGRRRPGADPVRPDHAAGQDRRQGGADDPAAGPRQS